MIIITHCCEHLLISCMLMASSWFFKMSMSSTIYRKTVISHLYLLIIRHISKLDVRISPCAHMCVSIFYYKALPSQTACGVHLCDVQFHKQSLLHCFSVLPVWCAVTAITQSSAQLQYFQQPVVGV